MCAVALVWVLGAVALTIAIQQYGYQDHARSADVIIVLGSGVRPNGDPTPPLRFRSERGAALWHEGIAAHVICTGSQPSWAANSEAAACREVLLREGVPSEAIFIEDHSRSTEENAIYAKQIMDANGWQSAVVVSDRYHLLRAHWFFEEVGIEAYTSPVAASYMRPFEYGMMLAREVVAHHWRVVRNALQLPITQVPIL